MITILVEPIRKQKSEGRQDTVRCCCLRHKFFHKVCFGLAFTDFWASIHSGEPFQLNWRNWNCCGICTLTRIDLQGGSLLSLASCLNYSTCTYLSPIFLTCHPLRPLQSSKIKDVGLGFILIDPFWHVLNCHGLGLESWRKMAGEWQGNDRCFTKNFLFQHLFHFACLTAKALRSKSEVCGFINSLEIKRWYNLY